MGHVIALLGAVAGLLWALNALGKSGFSLDPFAWWRRHQWMKRHGTKPLYRLRDPAEVAAVLLLGVAKCKGDVTATQKARLLDLYTRVLKMPADEADDMLVAATFLVKDEVYLVDSLEHVLANTRRALTAEQKASMLNLMEEVALVDGPVNAEQRKLIDRTMDLLNRRD
jgi:uncharacterized tellurite resistance protein B-like protein